MRALCSTGEMRSPHDRKLRLWLPRIHRRRFSITLRRPSGSDRWDRRQRHGVHPVGGGLGGVQRRAAGGKRQVSSYVATALEDYQERENLDDILAAWRAETPVPEEVRRQAEAELDQAGLAGHPGQDDRVAG